VLLLGGFVIYQYMIGPAAKVQNVTGGAQTGEKSSPSPTISAPQVQTPVGGAQTQGSNDTAGTFSVCSDKCGDGVCQKTDPNCGKNNNLNCTCLETPQECPQDCK
jgi:hypothetical protein